MFVFWVNLFSRDQIQSSVTMERPTHGRSRIDTRNLSIQELDSVEATYGHGKTNAITVAHLEYTLDLLGQPVADINKVVKEATLFISCILWLYDTMLFYG